MQIKKGYDKIKAIKKEENKMTQINMPSVNSPMIGDSLHKSDDDIFKDYFKRKIRLDECDIEDEGDDDCPYFEEELVGIEDEVADDGDWLIDDL